MVISISDVSLRQNGVKTESLSFKEKLDVAKNLAELGVNVIEVGPVFKDKADEVLIKTLCGVTGSAVLALVVTGGEAELEKNFSLISAAKNKRVIVEVPVSPVMMEYSFGKKPQFVLEHIKNMVKKAKEFTDDVEASLSDATRAERGFLFDCIKAAISGGAKTVTVTDEAGLFSPQEYADFIKDIYSGVPELKNVKLCTACSDALYTGAANTLSSVLCGASGIKLSALKNSGLPSVESFGAIAEGILYKKGFGTTLNKTGMSRILKRMASLSTGAVTGESETKNPVEEVGSLTRAELNKFVKKLGYDLSAEDASSVYDEYKRISANKKVGVKEIEAIVASTCLQVPPTYTLERFSVQSSNVISATANVVLKRNGKEVSGLSYGNGAIDAAFFALENIVGRRFELDDFQISALTEGKEAVGEAVVKLRFDGKIYSGRGISTDIVGASIRAYINAVNKIVYEEENK